MSDETRDLRPPLRLAECLPLLVLLVACGVPSAILVKRMAVGAWVAPVHSPDADQGSATAALAIPDFATFYGQLDREKRQRGKRQKLKPALKQYVNAQYGLKDEMVELAGLVHVAGLGVSFTERVLIGRDGWLFFAEEPALVEDARHNLAFPEAKLVAVSARLEAYRATLAGHGIDYLLAITPNKHTVYADHLPAWMQPGRHPPRRRVLVEHLAARHPAVRVVDTTAVVTAVRHQRGLQAYQKTDTHWTDAGAFAAYRAIATAAGITPLSWNDVDIGSETRPDGGDLARFLGIEKWVSESFPSVRPKGGRHSFIDEGQGARFERITGGNPAGPRIYLVRDSFAHRLIPLLAPHCSLLVCQWTTRPWSNQAELDRVLAEQPDLVIHQFVERMLIATEQL